MKKFTYLCLMFTLFVGGIHAQNRSIQFREGDWKSLLQEASKANKLIFLDCYTSWCGPCKMLARTVFTNDTVADFYNKHFICAKMDMEKGEGPALAKQYGVRAYPTLLYVNKEGKLVHNVVGMQKPAELVEQGQTAMEGKETLTAYRQRYEQGERDAAFMRKFIGKLSRSYQPALQAKVATEYINTLTDEQFYSRDCWNIIIYNINDPLSPVIKKLFANRKRFEQFIAKDTVDIFLDYTFRSKVSSYTWSQPHSKSFSQQAFDEYLGYLRSISWPKVPQYIASLYTAYHWIQGDCRGMLDEMRQALRYGIFYGDSKLTYIQAYITQLSKTKETELIAQSIVWMDELAAEATFGYYKSEYMKLKAKLLRSQGKESEATALEAEARKVRMSR